MAPSHTRRILISDDEPEIRDLYRSYFESLGWEVLLAQDGADAIEILKAHKLDAIITDIRMPKKSGIDLLHKVHRQKEKTGWAPVVVVTTGLLGEGAPYLRSMGVIEVFEKPVSLHLLGSTIERALAHDTPALPVSEQSEVG